MIKQRVKHYYQKRKGVNGESSLGTPGHMSTSPARMKNPIFWSPVYGNPLAWAQEIDAKAEDSIN